MPTVFPGNIVIIIGFFGVERGADGGKPRVGDRADGQPFADVGVVWAVNQQVFRGQLFFPLWQSILNGGVDL